MSSILNGGGPPSLPDDLMGLKDAAEFLKCTVTTLRRWISRGEIASYKRGGRFFVSKADAIAAFKAFKPDGGPRPMSQHERNLRDMEVDRILREAKVRR